MSDIEVMPLGIVVEQRTLSNPWQAVAWRAVAVLPGASTAVLDGESWRLLRQGDGWAQYLAGILPLELHRSDAASYQFNLMAPEPLVFVALRPEADGAWPCRLLQATVAPDEAQSLTDAGNDLVEGLAMPEAVRFWVGDFVARNHVDQPFVKRRRKGLDDIGGGRRLPGSRGRFSS